jgi:ribosome biogenesis GTPase
MEGIIIKGVAGFYYVKTENEIYQCKARGLFRKDGIVPYVGDRVTIRVLDNYEAIINEIHPRKNNFTRPPIANVDCLVIVMAVKKPEPNLTIMDRFLVMAEFYHTDILICINKIDLVEEEELKIYREIYEPIYPMVFVSGKTGQGIQLLKNYLKGRVSALTGPSGVGKSTLLNMMESRDIATVGEIGRKSQRGKHTTRHVELFDIEGGGMLFDTPGFTSLDVMDAEERELAFLYPEMVPYIGGCRYDNCRHLSEPDCRIREAVEDGKIHKSRYGSYMDQIYEIQIMRRY